MLPEGELAGILEDAPVLPTKSVSPQKRIKQPHWGTAQHLHVGLLALLEGRAASQTRGNTFVPLQKGICYKAPNPELLEAKLSHCIPSSGMGSCAGVTAPLVADAPEGLCFIQMRRKGGKNPLRMVDFLAPGSQKLAEGSSEEVGGCAAAKQCWFLVYEHSVLLSCLCRANQAAELHAKGGHGLGSLPTGMSAPGNTAAPFCVINTTRVLVRFRHRALWGMRTCTPKTAVRRSPHSLHCSTGGSRG